MYRIYKQYQRNINYDNIICSCVNNAAPASPIAHHASSAALAKIGRENGLEIGNFLITHRYTSTHVFITSLVYCKPRRQRGSCLTHYSSTLCISLSLPQLYLSLCKYLYYNIHVSILYPHTHILVQGVRKRSPNFWRPIRK